MSFVKQKSNSKFNSFLLISLLIPLSLSSCSIFKTEKHRPTILHHADFVFKDSRDNYYFDFKIYGGYHLSKYDSSCVDNLYYKYNMLNIKKTSGEILYYNNVCSNSSFLFAELRSNIKDSPMIAVFNEDLTEVYNTEFEPNIDILDMACTERFLYFSKKNKTDNSYSLCKLDFINNKTVELDIDFENQNSYCDSDAHLFFKDYGSEIAIYTEKTPLLSAYDEKKNKCFLTNEIRISQSKDRIDIVNKGNVFSFENNYGFNTLYPKAYYIDAKLIFAGYLFKQDKKCLAYNRKANCICGIKESYLFSFDLETNELTLVSDFKSGTFLIDYDLESVEYYYNGGLYVNNILSKECETIKPGDLGKFAFYYDYRNNDAARHYYFGFFNEQFFGI